jgi:hypothetical protein
MKAKSLNYSTREINRNFKIKVSGYVNGKKVNTLVGVSGLIRMLDGAIDLVNRLLDRAFNSLGDKCICKLRRGVKVSFYTY